MVNQIWDSRSYDTERRRLVPCFDSFYGTAVELVIRSVPADPAILDLGAGTGLLSRMVAERVGPRRICLIDASAEMLAQAEDRLASWEIESRVQELTSALPSGPFHAVVSALAIHHLADQEKRELLGRVYDVLVPGGIFVNAEQILGPTQWHRHLYERIHLDAARSLGSSEEEIVGAKQRMSYDRCAPLNSQLAWLREIGYERVDVFFQWFCFAVYAGWKSND